jgi:hypothetical protein
LDGTRLSTVVDGIKTFDVKAGDIALKIAVVSGLANVRTITERIKTFLFGNSTGFC